MATQEEKQQRIAKMLLDGYSINIICEWGVTSGWNRYDVKKVVSEHNWALDWDGRLQGRYRGEKAIQAVASRATIADVDIEYMISVGTDHDQVEIRRLAVKAQRAVDELRRALLIQEEKDAQEIARRATQA